MADEGSVAAVGAGVVLGVAIPTLIQGLVAGPTLQVGQPHSACPLPKHSSPLTRPDGTDVTSCEVEHPGGGGEKHYLQKNETFSNLVFNLLPPFLTKCIIYIMLPSLHPDPSPTFILVIESLLSV